MLEAIEKMTAAARGRAALMIGRCILRAIGDNRPVQLVQAQLLAEEVHDDVERIQEYGLHQRAEARCRRCRRVRRWQSRSRSRDRS
ncbi:phage baseplate assembly protein domain-containing protein [Massilia eburnea]|uniref:phage baseplate assembly protein domain-containing protein n=1 Tax=Massilia eburnea TaxID=1776165 RepID=UPI003D6A6936